MIMSHTATSETTTFWTMPWSKRTMACVQQPKIGGEVRPHQDSTFLRTDPPSVIGLWWALEDATKQNGCLWALPGAHAQGVARHFIRKYGLYSRTLCYQGERTKLHGGRMFHEACV